MQELRQGITISSKSGSRQNEVYENLSLSILFIQTCSLKACFEWKFSPIREGFKKKYGIFPTLVGWVGLKKSFSIKNKNKKHGLKMPKIA